MRMNNEGTKSFYLSFPSIPVVVLPANNMSTVICNNDLLPSNCPYCVAGRSPPSNNMSTVICNNDLMPSNCPCCVAGRSPPSSVSSRRERSFPLPWPLSPSLHESRKMRLWQYFYTNLHCESYEIFLH
jgi:hypothetical protein